MKQTHLRAPLLSISLILLIFSTGCVCQPGYYGGPLGCGSILNPGGVVDYVNGPIGADCGTNGGLVVGPLVGTAAGTACISHGVPNCGSCLGTVASGVRVIGEGAFSLAASPFLLLGSLISGGPCGYEAYPNCGCGSEIYYGDNCYQPHDFNDPCCGTYSGTSVAGSGCANCAGGHTEGIRYDGNVINGVSPTTIEPTDGVLETQPQVQPSVQPTPVSTPLQTGFRPVQQTSFRQPIRKPAQRVIPPPRSVVVPNNHQKKALPLQ